MRFVYTKCNNIYSSCHEYTGNVLLLTWIKSPGLEQNAGYVWQRYLQWLHIKTENLLHIHSNFIRLCCLAVLHYNDVIMSVISSQITSLTIVYSTVYSAVDQRKHQSPASLAFVRGIHRGPVNSLHKWPATRKMFPFDDVIMLRWYLIINIRSAAWFRQVSSAILNDVIQSTQVIRNLEEMFNFIVITLTADGLAPLGAGPSADRLVTKTGSCMYVKPVFEWLIHPILKCWLVCMSGNPEPVTTNICSTI